jgi:hypothetical protein
MPDPSCSACRLVTTQTQLSRNYSSIWQTCLCKSSFCSCSSSFEISFFSIAKRSAISWVLHPGPAPLQSTQINVNQVMTNLLWI